MAISTEHLDEAAPQVSSADDVKRIIRERHIEFLFAQFVDMHGKPSAKLVPAHHIDDLLTEGAGFAGFAAGDIGQRPHDPDLLAIPDPKTLTILPWQPNVARFACDVTVEGEPWPYCPRTILRNFLARAKELGFELKMGAELEYFLIRRREDGTIEVADQLDTLDLPCYDMRALTRNLDFVSQVAHAVTALGWDNYATDHEDANGQFEQNFQYADALTTCDRAVFFRYMVESLAQQRGLMATFMPKPFAHLTGNGCHFHVSLWSGGENVFEREASEDPRGLGLSELAYHFIGGLKASAKAYIAVTAPTVNSYKRLVVGAPTSGATWAPAYVSYGYNNRTQMLRIPAPGRIEDRTVDGSCNPYLAATAMLAAGLDGIDRGLEAGEPNSANLYELPESERNALGIELLPANLLDAVRELEQSDVLRRALGTTPDGDYVDYYAKVKRKEWQAAHEQITQWELDRYLQLF
ncbi:MAG: type III glutamate--ammonia ligase [Solirubrobacterales bacterium]|nr:type III glutamate--ammonia ligase [Solirubrobacterales bacterium]MBV9367020.1 type III glutamate--ammonia ligase [Solirubrobacterales bacterium]MBV9808648.1 type III glutamate--ammonia ligase [Solirubrobacterales bacterium]